MSVKCHACQAVNDANLCRRCTSQIRDVLAGNPTTRVTSLTELLTELDVTISRQDRGTGAALYAMNRARVQIPGVHYDEGDTTLPSTQWAFSWDAANTLWTIRNTLGTWARHLSEGRGVTMAGPPIDYLLANLDSIRLDEAVAEIHDELRACHRDALNAIDRQTPDVFLGRCEAMLMTTTECDGVLIPELAPCGEDLYCRTGDDEARCGACGARYDVVSQQRMLDQARPDALGTPAVIAGALTTEDREVSRAALNRWIERDARTVEGMKEGPTCAPRFDENNRQTIECTHRTCKSLRAAEIQAIIKRHGRPLILRQGWDGEGRSLYRAGDVEARLAWNDTQRGGMVAG